MAKFIRKGKSKVFFLPTVAGASPTRPEITAGTDLSPLLREIDGFDLQNSPVEAPNLAETFTAKIGGEDQVGDPTLTFNDDDATSAIRTALAKGTNGYIVRFPYGDVPTKRCEVYKVVSVGVNDIWTVGNEVAQFRVGFSIDQAPNQNATVPA